MKNRIAIITTEFMVDYIHSAFSKIQVDCDYELYIYETFRDIPQLYKEIPEDIIGVLTSGSFPARVIKLAYPDTERVIMPFNTDDAAICQLFFRLLYENRNLRFDRIYADLVEMFGIDLEAYLLLDFNTPLSFTTNQIVCEKGLEELFQIEEQEYEKHLKLWESGSVDLCVTRFSSIVDKLRKQGVPVYFPFPSIEYFRETCVSLLKDLEYRQMQDNCSAIIQIMVASEAEESVNFSMEYQIVTLQAVLMEHLGTTASDYFVGRSSSGIIIMTNRKNIEKLTEHYTVCKLQSYLRQQLSFKTYIGYGVGKNVQQSRSNAEKAMRQSAKSPDGGSFVINEEGALIGPLALLGKETSPFSTAAPEGAVEKKSTIPDYKAREVLEIMNEASEQEITSQELADTLEITKRSANRILSAMESQGLIQIVRTRATSAKGRPERVYRPI